MKRVAGIIVLFSVFATLYLASPQSQAVDANPWSSNISSQSAGALTPQLANNRYDCETKNIKSVSVSGANALLFKATTLLTGLTYTYLDDKCVVTNSHGVFTTRNIGTTNGPIQTSEYFGKSTSKMYDLVPTTATGQWIDPAPAGDIVLFLTKGSGVEEYVATMYKNFSDGYPKIRSNKLTFDFLGTPSSSFLDKNGQGFKINRHAFSPNGRYMTVSYNKTIAKIDLQTMIMTPVIYNSNARFLMAAVSNDGRFLALAGGEVRVYDSANCAISYDSGKWDRLIASTEYSGCTSTSYPSTHLKTTGSVLSGSTFKRPHFGIDNKTLYVALSAGTSVNDWSEIKFTANNIVTSTAGYLAMGDSFSSGEGDLFGGTWYEPGTDEQGDKDTFEGRNLCHLSRRSYPYLIAKELGLLSGDASTPTTPTESGLFHSVACSGAVLHNITGTTDGLFLENGNAEKFQERDNQYSNYFQGTLGRWQPGRLKQLDILDSSIFGGYSLTENNPEVITLGISGNDAGFGDTIKACTVPGTCKQAIVGSIDASNLALRIMRLKPKLVETYKSIKVSSPDSRVYVHGYPIFVQGYNGTCDANVRLDAQETAMVEQGIKYMNKVVQSAATEAGVLYVDIEDILDGTNLCSGVIDNGRESGRTVNGITAGNDINNPVFGLFTKGICWVRTGCLGSESFHPNQFAHIKYKNRLLLQTNNLTEGMPNPTKTNIPVPDNFFGSTAVNQAAIVNNGSNYTVVIPEPKPFLTNTNNSIKIIQDGLLPGSVLRVELQSTPTTITEITVPASGRIDVTITLPSGIESGAHELHLIGMSNYGEQIDYYEPIIIAVSDTDFDGDGVLNADDSCPATYNIFVDIDIDGIDDVCDPSAVASIMPIVPPIVVNPPLDTLPEPPVEIPVEIFPEEQPPTEEPVGEEEILVVIPDNQVPPDEVINLDGRNIDKGQSNPETVAGNEDQSQVLGATTSSNPAQNDPQQVLGDTNDLENTGTAVILNGLFGAVLVFLTIILFSRVRRD